MDRERFLESPDSNDTSEFPQIRSRSYAQESRISENSHPPAYGQEAIPNQPRARSSSHMWLLGSLTAVLAMALILGAFYMVVTLNDRNTTIDQVSGQLHSTESDKQALSNELATVVAERDDSRSQVEDLKGDVSDLQRQLSLARGDASREQGRANYAEVIGSVLVQVIDLDRQIQGHYEQLVKTTIVVADDFSRGLYASASRGVDQMEAILRNIERLTTQRDTLMGQLR